MLVDVTPLGVTGKEAEHVLDGIGITVNKNAIPFDPLPPNTSSGIRVGTPATTTRGFGAAEMREVGELIVAGHRAPRRRAGACRACAARPRHLRPLPGAGLARVVSQAALDALPVVLVALVAAALAELRADPADDPLRRPTRRDRRAQRRAARPREADPAHRRHRRRGLVRDRRRGRPRDQRRLPLRAAAQRGAHAGGRRAVRRRGRRRLLGLPRRSPPAAGRAGSSSSSSCSPASRSSFGISIDRLPNPFGDRSASVLGATSGLSPRPR